MTIATYDDTFVWTEPLPGLRSVSWTGSVKLREKLDSNCYVVGIRIVYTGPLSGGTLTITGNAFASYTVQYPAPFTDYANVAANAYGDLVAWTPTGNSAVQVHSNINSRGADEFFIQGPVVVSGVTAQFSLSTDLLGNTVYAQIHVGNNLCQCSVKGVYLSGA
ncbi:MAG TPA: hypothetical protein VEM95_01415, partial [Thermoplasmata archaeon]|nr:hypothetical protein [Thermoplasmata archaeon]